MPQARGRNYYENIGLKTDVSVKDAIVTLRGDAASEAQKELKTEYVNDDTEGKDIKKEMTVSEPQPGHLHAPAARREPDRPRG